MDTVHIRLMMMMIAGRRLLLPHFHKTVNFKLEATEEHVLKKKDIRFGVNYGDLFSFSLVCLRNTHITMMDNYVGRGEVHRHQNSDLISKTVASKPGATFEVR